MRARKDVLRCLAGLLLLGGFLQVLPAEELSLAEIAALARRENLAVLKAERALRQAQADLRPERRLKSSELSLGGDYTYTFDSGDNSLRAEAGISLPLLPQLTLEGSISPQAGKALAETPKELALTVRPFAPPDPLYPEEQAYGKAEAALRYLRQQVGLDAEQAALNLQARGMETELARRTLELEERKSVLAELRLQRGEISFQDAQDQLVSLTEARQDLFDSELGSLRDGRTLRLLFAPGRDEVTLAPLSLGQLRSFVDARSARLAAVQRQPPGSEKLENLRLDLVAQRAELAATPAWRPEASVSAGLGLPSPGVPPEQTFSLRLSLTLSPNQSREEDRRELEQDIAETGLEIQSELFALELERRLSVQSIALAEQAMAAALLQQDRATVAAREAEALFQQGKRTVLERDQLALNVRRAEIQSFRAAVELYRTQGQLLSVHVEAGPPPDTAGSASR